jgi:nitroreductase
MSNMIEALSWRYAVAKFDTSKKLSTEQLDILTEAIRLSPSSFGLQPWKFIIVTNPEIRSKLRAAGYNQAKIEEASHLFVFAVKNNLSAETVDTFIQSVSDTRHMPITALQSYSDMIKGAISMRTPEGRTEWAARQAYIALGVLVATGAMNGIDVAPMEGFDPQAFDQILGLDKLNLESKVIAAVGFRSAEDESANWPKVRFPAQDVLLKIE